MSIAPGLPVIYLQTPEGKAALKAQENTDGLLAVWGINKVPYIDFSGNQWTGPITEKDFSYKGNILALGPAAEDYSEIESLLLIGLLNRMSQTPQGMAQISSIAKSYLGTIGKIVDGLHMAGTANPFNNAINEYIAVGIYRRLGLLSPRDATQCRAWVDHYFGLMLQKDYFKDTISGLTTLVKSTSTGGESKEATSGLATLAKVLGGA